MPDFSPQFPAVHLPQLDKVELPRMYPVRLRHPELAAIADVPAAVRAALDSQADRFPDRPGAEIAIAVGSRGIAQIDVVAKTAVDWLRARGLSPFIVPAMGSHGGATSEGQTALLAKLGVSEDRMGCPVRSSLDTVDYGQIDGGFTCHFDAHAAAADGVLVINRVKAHTSFPRPVESGLTKMLAVGLGKREGAAQVHRDGPRGLAEVLPRLAQRMIERAPLSAGLALVENAREEIAHVEAAAPEAFYDTDARLLEMSKSAMARLPFDRLDGLIVEQVGKDISGAGMDPAVCGRTDIRGIDNPATPFIHKIAVLGITEASEGNGMGVGIADFIPRALAGQLDLRAMYMNAVTATILEKARIPIVLRDERDVLRALVATCWPRDPGPRICQIRSTLHLGEIAVTEALLDELRAAERAEQIGDPYIPGFDDDGRLRERLTP